MVRFIQVFLEEDIFRYFVEDLWPIIKLISELRKERSHIESRRHGVGVGKINGCNESRRGVIGILSDKNILWIEISVSLYQILGMIAL